jgi:hypothetical protein
MVTWLTVVVFLASVLAALVVFGGLAVIGCQYCRGSWRDDARA